MFSILSKNFIKISNIRLWALKNNFTVDRVLHNTSIKLQKNSENKDNSENESFRFVKLQSTGDSKNSESDSSKKKTQAKLKVIFELENGRQLIGKAQEGDTLLDVVLNNELDLDGFGACEGTLSCSTCHLILSQEVFDSLPKKITDEEMDMLDLAYGLTETSRLGCQITMTKDLDGLHVKVPSSVNDVRLQ